MTDPAKTPNEIRHGLFNSSTQTNRQPKKTAHRAMRRGKSVARRRRSRKGHGTAYPTPSARLFHRRRYTYIPCSKDSLNTPAKASKRTKFALLHKLFCPNQDARQNKRRHEACNVLTRCFARLMAGPPPTKPSPYRNPQIPHAHKTSTFCALRHAELDKIFIFKQ